VPVVIEPWDRARAADLEALARAGLTDDELSLDELLSCCWDDPGPDAAPGELGVVLGTAGGEGAVSVVRRDAGGGVDAWVKLLVVDPPARRRGLGRSLLAAAERWAWDQGAIRLHLGGSPPFYLWPGIDGRADAMLGLAEAAGYVPTGTALNMELPTATRPPLPEGIEIRRALEDADVVRVCALVDREWPTWRPEVDRAVDHGCCHVAVATGGTGESPALGFVAHSVSRAGWIGPLGTDPASQGSGIGSALLGVACRDLMIAEFDTAEICWVGPVEFYARHGAVVSRTFHQFVKRRPES
jgi:GNAT superfamily N-acetyltransferase